MKKIHLTQRTALIVWKVHVCIVCMPKLVLLWEWIIVLVFLT